MRIGIDVSIAPVAVMPKTSARLPSWKIHTIAPNVAVRLRALRTRALSGTSTLPDSRNSRIAVDTTTSAERERQP